RTALRRLILAAPRGVHKVARDFVAFDFFENFIPFESSARRPDSSNSGGPRADKSDVRTALRTKLVGPRRARSRFGYDHRWWGEAARVGVESGSYWSLTRRPLPCLLFVLPILAAYEVGVLWLGGASAEASRTGADAWMRNGLATLGFTDQ